MGSSSSLAQQQRQIQSSRQQYRMKENKKLEKEVLQFKQVLKKEKELECQDEISDEEYSDGEETNGSSIESIQISQLESSEYRFVNHPRIKQIIVDYQSRGDEDIIIHQRKYLYRKSPFAI